MESQPQNPEFRINLENFHPCIKLYSFSSFLRMTEKSGLKSSQLCTCTVKTLYSNILYNSKILYNDNCI